MREEVTSCGMKWRNELAEAGARFAVGGSEAGAEWNRQLSSALAEQARERTMFQQEIFILENRVGAQEYQGSEQTQNLLLGFSQKVVNHVPVTSRAHGATTCLSRTIMCHTLLHNNLLALLENVISLDISF